MGANALRIFNYAIKSKENHFETKHYYAHCIILFFLDGKDNQNFIYPGKKKDYQKMSRANCSAASDSA